MVYVAVLVRRGFLILLLCGGLLGFGGGLLLVRGRLERCAAVPVLVGDLLPAVDGGRPRAGGPLPEGWSALAPGVQVGDFAVVAGTHSFQLIGIANALRTPPVAVRPGDAYCVAAQALADSPVSSTRLRLAFHWLDEQGRTVAVDQTGWQDVRRWGGQTDRGGWSRVGDVFRAPAGATRLMVAFHPASDDRVYLDDIHVRWTLDAAQPPANDTRQAQPPVTIEPWPDGRRAALSFSFDWETAMGGLIHSRSVDDPNGDQDPLLRAMRMRAGVTTTLDLFRPYGIRATYYANGYNFLLGNPDRRQFMGNPTFAWADSQPPHNWRTDHWKTTPWFAADPYGTVASDPQWYFGDLIPLLQRERQDIQSHTFSHLYGGFARPDEWHADLAAWQAVAAERGVAPARSLAFPWSGSGGMSYAGWDELEAAGITSVTRTSKQSQYQLASERDPRCRPVPGHERILACPDFYLTERSAGQALKLIDGTIDAGGMLDLWAHTEEVVAPGQVAAWAEVVRYAAQQRDAGRLWIAPLAEVAAWQQALGKVRVEGSKVAVESPGAPLKFTITNGSDQNLDGLTLSLPFSADRYTLNGGERNTQDARRNMLELDIAAGQSVEVVVWPL